LEAEFAGRVRGEAGWSAEWRKRKLIQDDIARRSRFWREYCCESFCDTAAALNGKANQEVTLSRTRIRSRAAWFRTSLPARTFPI
jgi:hypothetical protein